ITSPRGGWPGDLANRLFWYHFNSSHRFADLLGRHRDDIEEELLTGLLSSLGRVKDITLGDYNSLDALSRLRDKGFKFSRGHRDPKIEDDEWNKEDEEKEYRENEDEKDDDEDEEEDEQNKEEEDEGEEDNREDDFLIPMKFINDFDKHDSYYDRSSTLAECEMFASKI
nr:hypothetical protein [Tanacetum cinerariifolium]